MRSPHLDYLDSLIAKAIDAVDADCLRLRRAGCQAKLGQMAEAKAEVDRIRLVYERFPNARISSWTHLAESQISYFSNLGAAAFDRAKRAHALCTAMRINDIRAIAAAWLAHYHFELQELGAVAAYAKEALEFAERDQHEVFSRVALVVALCLDFAARPDLARPWYASARAHAVAEHDEMTTSAIMYDMTAMRATNLRLLELDGTGVSEKAETVLSGAESTLSYDSAIGANGQDTYVALLKAQILSHQRKWAAAAELYSANLAPSAEQGLARLRCWYLSDLAWCELNLDRRQKASELVVEALECITPETHLDDRAAAQARIAQVLRALGEETQATTMADQAAANFHEFAKRRAHIVDSLSPLAPK